MFLKSDDSKLWVTCLASHIATFTFSCCCYCFRQQSPNTPSGIWKEDAIVVARCSGYFTCGWQFGWQSDNSVVGVHTSVSESFIQIILYITFILVSYLTCFTWSENQEEWPFYNIFQWIFTGRSQPKNVLQQVCSDKMQLIKIAIKIFLCINSWLPRVWNI